MKLSKLALETRVAALDKENTVLLCALNDVLRGDVKWFGRGEYRLGVCRPSSACGGIAIVQRSGMANAFYFEDYAQTELNHVALLVTGADTEHNRDLLARRSVIEDAKAYVRTCQQSAA